VIVVGRCLREGDQETEEQEEKGEEEEEQDDEEEEEEQDDEEEEEEQDDEETKEEQVLPLGVSAVTMSKRRSYRRRIRHDKRGTPWPTSTRSWLPLAMLRVGSAPHDF